MLLLSFRCIFIVLRSLLQYLLVLILGFFLDIMVSVVFFFFSSRRRHTRYIGDWSSDVCSSDLAQRDPRQARLSRPSRSGRGASAALRSGWSPSSPRRAAGRPPRCASSGHVTAGRSRRPPRSEERRVGKEYGARGERQEGKKRGE